MDSGEDDGKRNVEDDRQKEKENMKDGDELSKIIHKGFALKTKLNRVVSVATAGSTEETAKHLVFQCPKHDQAWSLTWLDLQVLIDPRRL